MKQLVSQLTHGDPMPDKRTRLIRAANQIVYEHGFHQTTLARIASAAKVPLGNVYYYFKTKEAIGGAVIEDRAVSYRAMRQEWEKRPDPRSRLEAFVEMSMLGRSMLARGGCPIGSLCTELHKQGGPLATDASALFSEFLEWLEAQFQLLGWASESRDHAVHLMSAVQGASVLAQSFGDPAYVERECRLLLAWIRGLDAPSAHRR